MAGEPRTIDAPIPGPANSQQFILPPGLTLDVEAVYVEVDAAGAGGPVTGELVIAEQSGVVIATKRQSQTIPPGGAGTATWALRLSDDGSVTVTPGANPNLIFTRVLTAPVPFVDIVGIPQAWRDIQLVASARSDNPGALDALMVQFNGDAAANYSWQQSAYPSANGTTLAASFGTNGIWCGEIGTAFTAAHNFGTIVAVLSHYTQVGTYKNMMGQFCDNKVQVGVEQVIGITGGTWADLSPITSLRVFPAVGPNLDTDTQISLYGI